MAFVLKDYYKILAVEPSATIPEIKKAYRKLAHQYHPDKSNNDPYAIAQFAEIKEAYEVLTDPAKKEYYLQQRWYAQSIGKRKTESVVTPVTILQQAIALERHTATIDVFRMDKNGLRDYILDMLNSETIQKLQSFDEPFTIRQIIDTILRSLKPLTKEHTITILESLRKLSPNDKQACELINQFEEKQQQRHKSEKLTIPAVILITLLICLIMWLASR
ncbi:MAG TPA: DnaJ domain-containing protein [Chitinophagaceae bacterium]|nr:DnaJ domain-containing protein [Chitinophagaceae bacterium]HMU57967.1 DnaJ domain-containing protein [Chitinophagaceae bacterium]